MPYIATRDDVDLYVKDWGESRPVAAGIARSQLVEYDGAPHGLFVTHQAKLIADLKSFLSN